MTLGIVCGFAAEQQIAAEVSSLTAVGWHNPEAASGLIARGATTLISFGIAGGLDPTLRSGDLLLPSSILADGAPMTCSTDLQELLAAAFPGARREPLVYSPRIVATRIDKRRLFTAEGAIATDMESGIVARVAQDAGIPFAVLRSVSDLYSDDLPPAALTGLTPEGDVDYLAVIGSLLRHPGQLQALIRTGRQSKQALARLRQAAPTLKGLFG